MGVLWLRGVVLARRERALSDPLRDLTRKQRREYRLELLKRERDEYEADQRERVERELARFGSKYQATFYKGD